MESVQSNKTFDIIWQKITSNNSVVIQRADFVTEIRDMLTKEQTKVNVTMSYVLSVSLPEVGYFQTIMTLSRYAYTVSSSLTVNDSSYNGHRRHFCKRSRR